MIDQIFLTIIIPCRKEEKYIGNCLDSILANDYPRDRLEILVVDGMSEDGTREIITKYAQRHSFIKLLDNPKQIIPSAMNVGIRNANGKIIMKIDAHSIYPREYISNCVRFLSEYHADNVGGICKIIPRSNTKIAEAIAFGLSHPFGSGNAHVKIGAKEPHLADTVAFGCYRREVFEEIGLFNEELPGSSDMDFNTRLKRAGGKIVLFPEIFTGYYSDPDFKTFWKHNFSDGVWATYVLKFKSKAWSLRHWIPLIFVSSLIGLGVLSLIFHTFCWLPFALVVIYTIVSLLASLQISIKKGNLSYLLLLPIVFAIRHFAHGLGALFGMILVLVPGKRWKGRRGISV